MATNPATAIHGGDDDVALPAAPAAEGRWAVDANDDDDDGVPNDQLLDYAFPVLDVALSAVPAPLFGGRALMMMVAHSEVAIAVQRHSTYASSPFLRLWDTLCLATALVKGGVADRKTSLLYIHRKHGAIQGSARGTGCPYSANSPHAQLFVWACLVENVDVAFRLLGEPSPPGFADALYRDWKVWARQFGIPRRHIPSTRHAFDRYMAAELAARLPLHPESAKVLHTMKEIGSSPGKLPLLGLPLYPALAFYREFNIAALACVPATEPLAAAVQDAMSAFVAAASPAAPASRCPIGAGRAASPADAATAAGLTAAATAAADPAAATGVAGPSTTAATAAAAAAAAAVAAPGPAGALAHQGGRWRRRRRAPAIIRAVRLLWGLLPTLLRWAMMRMLRACMLPLAPRFRKAKLLPLREAAHRKLVLPVVRQRAWEAQQHGPAAAPPTQSGGGDAPPAAVATAAHAERRDFVDGFNHLCELRRGCEWETLREETKGAEDDNSTPVCTRGMATDPAAALRDSLLNELLSAPVIAPTAVVPAGTATAGE